MTNPALCAYSILERTENPSPWLEELPNLFDATTYTTQPYVSAKPDVAVRSLEKNKDAKGQLKFVVAATDGRKCAVTLRPALDRD